MVSLNVPGLGRYSPFEMFNRFIYDSVLALLSIWFILQLRVSLIPGGSFSKLANVATRIDCHGYVTNLDQPR